NTSNRNGKVNITAKGNIYLSEISGDLNLEKMITNGDVWLKVVNGNLVDANKLQTRDERTYQELLDTVYSRLQLMDETGAQDKIDHLCQSLVVIKTQEYRTYWQYRLMQTNPSVYDNSFIVNLTAAETTWYTDFYSQQGADIGLTGEDLTIFVNNALQTLVNARTEQYRSLHVNYGSLGDSFDPDYQYSLSQTEMDTMKAGVKVWTQAELLQLISGNLLKPVSSTMTDIEDPNIVARNITLEVSGTVGSYKSTPVILPVADGKLGALTDDQKVALAAAERSDIVYVGPAVDAVSFSLSNNQIKLTAPSGTNWQQLGFTAAGMEVHLRNIYLNWLVASEQEAWKVESVNGSELTLSIQKTISPYITYFINLSTVDVISNIIDPGYYLSAENSDLQYAKITALNIYSRDDINIDSNGMINAKAGNGIYLGGGKEMQGDLNLAVIQSLNNGEIRIRSHRNVINSAVTPQTNANVITGGDVVLEAGGGSVGESDRPVYTAISGDGMLTARADKNVYISQVQLENGSPILNGVHPYLTAGNAPDLKISNIYAQTGEIVIRTDGLILDGEKTDFTKLLAKHVILTAGKGIGESDDPLEVHTYFSADQPGNGWLKATALNHVNLSDPEGDMGVLNVLSYEGNVNLSALNSILDAGDPEDPYNPASDLETESVGGRWPKANIIAENVTLETTLGGIGTADNELDIDSSYSSGSGRLTASTGNLLNTYLIETAGDMNLNTVTTGMDVIAFITAPAGSILNGAATGISNIISGKTKLFAANNIGAADNKLISEVGGLEGTATNGGVWIYNNGKLVLSSVTGSGPAVHGKGDIEIISGCPETIATDIISDSGSIKIWAKDDDGAVGESGNVLPDDLTVKSGVTLRTVAQGTFILLSAGDDLIIEEGASLIAAGDIILRADANTIDASGELNPEIDAVNTDHDPDRGANVELHGTYIVGADNRVYVQTYDNNDIINLYASLRSRVTTGAGNDQIRFFGSSALTDGGVIDGGSGFDMLDYTGYDSGINIHLTDTGTIDGFKGSEPSISGGFDNIDAIIGSNPYHNLTGMDVDSLWDILANEHTIYSLGGNMLDLSGIECLNGGYADDDFRPEPGAFYSGTINGGDGVNWLDYSAYTTPVDANLTTLTVPGLQPESFSNIYNLIGGSADDVLTGNDRDNRLFGGSGNDDLYGLDGNDILNGGRGSDRMFGGKGNDIFIFIGDEQIEDQIDGGAGLNTLDFSGSNSGI
ncbi:MAG TPA: calcium-binding protein, partial [Flexilinea sp.]|nr:calcium-binding protein [Flexilinea sp.]